MFVTLYEHYTVQVSIFGATWGIDEWPSVQVPVVGHKYDKRKIISEDNKDLSFVFLLVLFFLQRMTVRHLLLYTRKENENSYKGVVIVKSREYTEALGESNRQWKSCKAKQPWKIVGTTVTWKSWASHDSK